MLIISDTSFVIQSLINNLFYLRTLREFCLTLELSFYKNNNNLIEISKDFGKRFEELGAQTLEISNNKIPSQLIESGSFVTNYTLNTELLTEKLFDVDINTNLTIGEMNLIGSNENVSIEEGDIEKVRQINTDAIALSNNFIDFCNYILSSMGDSNVFSYSYPLIHKYMVEEASLYVKDIERLQAGTQVDPTYIINFQYRFCNSMRQACQFIIGLSDPQQTTIITNSDNYRKIFVNLMKRYEDAKVSPDNQKVLNEETINVMVSFQSFLSKIIEGILNQEYYFIMNPVFFDNLLTEANYFLYLLRGSDLGFKN